MNTDSERPYLLAMYTKADRLLLMALVIAWVVALAVGYAHHSLVSAFWIGLVPVAAVSLLVWMAPGQQVTRIAMAVALMSLVALQIHVARGLAETHFGVFVALALLVAYRDWRVVVAGAATIAVHHLAFNHLQSLGWGVFCLSTPNLEMVLYHAGYVVVQSFFGIMIALQIE